MTILFAMIPLAIMLLAAAIAAFFWAVGSGQFDDLEARGSMVLFDDEPVAPARVAAADGAEPDTAEELATEATTASVATAGEAPR